MLSKLKSRNVAAILALTGMFAPISGLHKFYLGQPLWGLLYMLLSWTPIPKVASAIEGVWYLVQNQDEFDRNFNLNLEPASTKLQPPQASAIAKLCPAADGIAQTLRQLDSLRQDGLVSEYEFEQKRRQMLDRIG